MIKIIEKLPINQNFNAIIDSWGLTIQLTPLKRSYNNPEFIFILIFAFILYKIFNFITKIFPVPFKKIGYIFSIDLIKDIYIDLKKDIKENYLKK